jgi:hypothetical protein
MAGIVYAWTGFVKRNIGGDCATSRLMKRHKRHKQTMIRKMSWATFQKIEFYPKWERVAGCAPIFRADKHTQPKFSDFLASNGRFFAADLLHYPCLEIVREVE